MLHVLLWSLDQFLQHGLSCPYYTSAFVTVPGIDELRSLILRSDTIYALVQLQSSEKLPEDSQRLLSDLIVDGQNVSMMRHEYFPFLRYSHLRKFVTVLCSSPG